jgi:alpha-L-fucosidase 2
MQRIQLMVHADLGDLTEPLWTLMDKMEATGRQTAKAIYKAGGWCCHHNTDLWGDSVPQDVYAQGAYWPMGGAWLVTHIFEHYRFSGDRAFLESKYDTIHGAVEFYHTFLKEYKGWMVTNPSVSPENNYVNGSSSSSGAMTVGSTIDNSILWELFSILDEAAVILKKPVNPFITKTRLLRSQLPPLRVSPTTGGIMEWIADFKESDPGHRHMSHLWGLFPGNEITAANQTLFTAAKNSLVRRLQYDTQTDQAVQK